MVDITQEDAQVYEGMFGDYSQDQLKDEIVRTVKVIQDHEESKKAEAKSWTDLIKDEKKKLQYLAERIDYLQHEDAVANHLDQGAA